MGLITAIALVRSIWTVHFHEPISPINSPLTIAGTVSGDNVGYRAAAITVTPKHLSNPKAAQEISGDILVQRSNIAVELGDEVAVTARSLTRLPRRPGPLSEAALEKDHVVALAEGASVSLLAHAALSPSRVLESARTSVTSALRRHLADPAATLLLGILFGIHGSLDSSTHAALQDSGLIHIVAISGLKVAILMGMLARLHDWRQWSRRRFILASALIVGFYVVFTGASAAAMRSGLMSLAALLISRDGRRLLPAVSLSLCAALLLTANPFLLTDVGFQLSFLGTAGILLLSDPIAHRIPGPRWWRETTAVTIAAQLFTFPITAAVFGSISLIGPLANALVLPLLLPAAIAIGELGTALLFIVPPLGTAVLGIAGFICDLIVIIARSLAALPAAAIHLGNWPLPWTIAEVAGASATLLTYIAYRRLANVTRLRLGATAGLLSACIALLASPLLPQPFRVVALDVASGTAVLVQTTNGKTLLIDAGADPAHLMTALGRELSPLQSRIDGWIINSSDRRAVGGAQALAARYSVGDVWMVGNAPAAVQEAVTALQRKGAAVHWLDLNGSGGPADLFTIGGLLFRCLPDVLDDGCSLQLASRYGSALLLPPGKPDDQDELAAEHGRSLPSDLIVTTAPLATSLQTAGQYVVVSGKGSGAGAYARTYSDGDVAFSGGGGGLVPDS